MPSSEFRLGKLALVDSLTANRRCMLAARSVDLWADLSGCMAARAASHSGLVTCGVGLDINEWGVWKVMQLPAWPQRQRQALGW